MRLPPYQATSSLVFTPSICTSDADSYWFDLDLRLRAAGQNHGFSQKPNHAKEKEIAPPDEQRRELASSPLVSEDGTADVEPDALAVASLHHLAASAAGDEGWGWEELRRRRLPGRERNPSGRRWWWFMYPSIAGMDGQDRMDPHLLLCAVEAGRGLSHYCFAGPCSLTRLDRLRKGLICGVNGLYK
jgi:hypothetical protein